MFQAPTQTPPIPYLVDALPTADRRQIARHLGVSVRTVARWIRTGNAPRMAHLALFWETSWGLSLAHERAAEGERIALSWARSLEANRLQLLERIAQLEALQGCDVAANAPFYDPQRPPPAAGQRWHATPGRQLPPGERRAVQL